MNQLSTAIFALQLPQYSCGIAIVVLQLLRHTCCVTIVTLQLSHYNPGVTFDVVQLSCREKSHVRPVPAQALGFKICARGRGRQVYAAAGGGR